MGCADLVTSHVHFLDSLKRHGGGLNFNYILFDFLSKVYQIKGMSEIKFEADPLTFTVSGMT